ncbi:alpha/beta hydrolase [Aurantiacibacter arachoides]|uniref:alpha/beta hydrolase n=1 Tax=Aurantiacibacter arachoides TaxID=1850444 RepID=UPI00166953A4|nr:alpha/beta hydrolase [Aurantiacibacter arachoides]
MLAAVFAAPATARDEVGAARYVSAQHAAVERAALAAFGPFRVIDDRTVAIVDVTDERSPDQFVALLARYPGIATLDFVEAPGTHDDRANFALARMVRAHGIATRAPAGGSVRSGAVELFLAGVSRTIDAGSEFAVHGWLDERGRGAQDFPEEALEHRRYLDFYMEMGMGAAEARAFYTMTNSVPFEGALWLTGREMQGWMDGRETAVSPSLAPVPSLAYASLPL